ncbi:hypothetical protein NQZ68_014762 [Dissostichus eleginoides]|nr:hypothetical protein NQZ68_014762 [Dissostichus eleginoides]
MMSTFNPSVLPHTFATTSLVLHPPDTPHPFSHTCSKASALINASLPSDSQGASRRSPRGGPIRARWSMMKGGDACEADQVLGGCMWVGVVGNRRVSAPPLLPSPPQDTDEVEPPPFSSSTTSYFPNPCVA